MVVSCILQVLLHYPLINTTVKNADFFVLKGVTTYQVLIVAKSNHDRSVRPSSCLMFFAVDIFGEV